MGVERRRWRNGRGSKGRKSEMVHDMAANWRDEGRTEAYEERAAHIIVKHVQRGVLGPRISVNIDCEKR